MCRIRVIIYAVAFCCNVAYANEFSVEISNTDDSSVGYFYKEPSIEKYRASGVGHVINSMLAHGLKGDEVTANYLKAELQVSSKQYLAFTVLTNSEGISPVFNNNFSFLPQDKGDKSVEAIEKFSVPSNYVMVLDVKSNLEGVKRSYKYKFTKSGENEPFEVVGDYSSEKYFSFIIKTLIQDVLWNSSNGFKKRIYDKKNKPALEVEIDLKIGKNEIIYENFYNSIEELPDGMKKMLESLEATSK